MCNYILFISISYYYQAYAFDLWIMVIVAAVSFMELTLTIINSHESNHNLFTIIYSDEIKQVKLSLKVENLTNQGAIKSRYDAFIKKSS